MWTALTIAGLIIDAGEKRAPSLLEVGPVGSKADHATDPTFLYDLTVRTGGPAAGRNDTGVVINSNNVVVDHIWIWRADHGAGCRLDYQPHQDRSGSLTATV